MYSNPENSPWKKFMQAVNQGYLYFCRKRQMLPFYIKKNTASFPLTIYVAINSTCNLHCKMCDVGQRQKGTQFYQNMVASHEEIPLDALKKLIDDVKKYKPIIAVTSTEPLLYRNLIEFCRYTVENGLEIQITTNGYLLPDLAEELVKIPITMLYVSLDGPQNIHNSIRGRPDSYQRAIEGISRISIIKKQKQLQFPKISINYSISNYNYQALVEFFQEVKEMDIEGISFSHLNFVTPDMARVHNQRYASSFPATPSSISMINPSEISIDLLNDQIYQIKKISQNCSFVPDMTEEELTIYYKNPSVFLKNHNQCKIPWSVAQIFANGDVGISTRCFNITFGNIHKEKFEEIWNGDRMKNFRDALIQNDAFPACSRCCGVF